MQEDSVQVRIILQAPEECPYSTSCTRWHERLCLLPPRAFAVLLGEHLSVRLTVRDQMDLGSHGLASFPY